MSEGMFVDVRPYNDDKKAKETDEASDTYDTIDWLIKNTKKNNGNVGVFGISYPGFYSTMAALSNHPASFSDQTRRICFSSKRRILLFCSIVRIFLF